MAAVHQLRKRVRSSSTQAGLNRVPQSKATTLSEVPDAVQLQRRIGNLATHHLLQMMHTPSPGVTSTVMQLMPNRSSSMTMAPHQPRSLYVTPASALGLLPQNIRDAHSARLAANDLHGALMVVVHHMEAQGEIDRNQMATPTATSRGAAVCRNHATVYLVEASIGSSAFTTKCNCTGPAGHQLPNVRIQVGPGVVRRIETLHSTLFHEFRHVRQAHSACNRARISSQYGVGCVPIAISQRKWTLI